MPIQVTNDRCPTPFGILWWANEITSVQNPSFDGIIHAGDVQTEEHVGRRWLILSTLTNLEHACSINCRVVFAARRMRMLDEAESQRRVERCQTIHVV